MKYQFDNIDEIYEAPSRLLVQGSRVRIKVDCKEPIDKLNGDLVKELLGSWTFPSNRKYIKPFRLEDFNLSETSFEAIIKILEKEKEVDELKLFCQDLLDFLNTDHIHVIGWAVEVIS